MAVAAVAVKRSSAGWQLAWSSSVVGLTPLDIVERPLTTKFTVGCKRAVPKAYASASCVVCHGSRSARSSRREACLWRTWASHSSGIRCCGHGRLLQGEKSSSTHAKGYPQGVRIARILSHIARHPITSTGLAIVSELISIR